MQNLKTQLKRLNNNLGNQKELDKIPAEIRLLEAWFALGAFSHMAKLSDETKLKLKIEILEKIALKWDIKVTKKRKKHGNN